MQKKLEGKLLKNFLDCLEKEDPKFYDEVKTDLDGELYITKIHATSTYSPDIPEKLINFFRGGYLEIGIINGQKVYLPTMDDFCIIHKFNVDLINIWAKDYKEMEYAVKITNRITEQILQNEVLSARNSSGALAILKARFGGRWKDEKENKQHTFNILMGNLGEVEGRQVKTPELASANPIDVEAKELVDPKKFDRVISVEAKVDVIGEAVKDRLKGQQENLHKGRKKAFARQMKLRTKSAREAATKKIKGEILEFLKE